MINDHHHHDCLFCNNPGVPLPGHILGLRIGKYHFGIFFPVDLFDNNDIMSYVATNVKIILMGMNKRISRGIINSFIIAYYSISRGKIN